MPRHPTLAVVFMLVAYVHAIPLDEIATRDGVSTASTGIGSQTNGGSLAVEAAVSCPPTVCPLVNESVLKLPSEDMGDEGDASSGAANGHSLLRPVNEFDSSNSTGEPRGGPVAGNLPALINGSNSTNSTGDGGSSAAGSKAKGGSLANNLLALIGGSNSTNSTSGASKGKGSSRADGERGGSIVDKFLAIIGGSNSTNSTGGDPQSRKPSGASSEVKGRRSTDVLPVLIEPDSNNAEQGGDTSGRNGLELVNQAGDVGQKGRKILTS